MADVCLPQFSMGDGFSLSGQDGTGKALRGEGCKPCIGGKVDRVSGHS